LGKRQEKEKKVAEIKDDLSRAKIVVLTDFRGLNVAQMNNLRRTLRQDGVKYQVVKNTLTKIAAGEVGLDDLKTQLEGPMGIAYGFDDPLASVKALVKFAKENDKFSLKGGVFENKLLDEVNLKQLADLPPREVLLARVVGSMQAPLSAFANVLQANLRNLVYALQAIHDQKN
jgi:large subunit ribosomal protein L10